jgi:hypothetical protein
MVARYYVNVVGRQIGLKDGRKVAWLTVREAAEWLEISEAAVRKRMERGTLDHEKWLDGRVYVYMPARNATEKGAEQNAAPQVAEDPARTPPRSWLEYVAVGTGVIAVLGGLIYAQGLLTLWIPIWRTYTSEASTAWYAAFLERVATQMIHVPSCGA